MESEILQNARILQGDLSHTQESRSDFALQMIVSNHHKTGKKNLWTESGRIREISPNFWYTARVIVTSAQLAASRNHTDLSIALWAALMQILAGISDEVQSCQISY